MVMPENHFSVKILNQRKMTASKWLLLLEFLNWPGDGKLLSTPCFKKTSTHIIGYKLRNSCPILIIFDSKIPHII